MRWKDDYYCYVKGLEEVIMTYIEVTILAFAWND
jgi:hypothetical protein